LKKASCGQRRPFKLKRKLTFIKNFFLPWSKFSQINEPEDL